MLFRSAASGIGAATAALLAEEGATVAAFDRTAVSVPGGRGWAVDLADPDAITASVGAAVTEFGAIDAVVNCAGVSVPTPVDGDGYWDAWALTLAVNVEAYVKIIRAALDRLLESPAGRIVNVASTEGLGATPYLSPYTVSKHGVIGLTRSLACELGPRGVNVNCVCPGPIRTGMTAPIPDDAKAVYARRRVPLGRYGQMHELCNLLTLLQSDGCNYITGANIAIDGGHHLAAPSTFAEMGKLTPDDWAQAKAVVRARAEQEKKQRSTG